MDWLQTAVPMFALYCTPQTVWHHNYIVNTLKKKEKKEKVMFKVNSYKWPLAAFIGLMGGKKIILMTVADTFIHKVCQFVIIGKSRGSQPFTTQDPYLIVKNVNMTDSSFLFTNHGRNKYQAKKNKLKCKFSFYSDFVLQQKLCKAFRRHFPHIRAIFKTLCMASATKYSFKTSTI